MKKTMKMQKKKHGTVRYLSLIFFYAVLIGVSGCGVTKSSENRPEQFTELKKIVEENSFMIEHDWAIPLGGNQINLVGNPNYIKFYNDSVDVFLPYFGVRQFGGGYGSSGAIEYKGPAKNLSFEEKKKKIIMEFEGRQGTETYEFTINIFPSKSVSTSVNSSQRQMISYRGTVEELEER